MITSEQMITAAETAYGLAAEIYGGSLQVSPTLSKSNLPLPWPLSPPLKLEHLTNSHHAPEGLEPLPWPLHHLTQYKEVHTMKTTYNTAAIMRNAWTIYHAADMGDGIKPLFSLCLAMAWDREKRDPARIAGQWNALQPLQQMGICAAAIRNYNRRIAPAMRAALSNVAEDLVQEVWINLYERMDPAALTAAVERADRDGTRRPSLENMAYNAAAAAVRKYAGDVLEGLDRVEDMEDEDGHTLEAVDLNAAHAAAGELVNRPTEKRAVDKLRLGDFMERRDRVDWMILEGIRDGYTEREIATRLGTMTQQAVNKRRRHLVRDMMEAGIMPSYYPAAV